MDWRPRIFRCGQASAAMLQMPQEVWGALALYLQPRDFARLLGSRSEFLLRDERQKLWRHFCREMRFVRESLPLAPLDDSSAPSRPRRPPLDWSKLFQANAAAEAGQRAAAFCWLWLAGEELRLPAGDEASVAEEASMQRLWLQNHSWRPPTAVRQAFLRVLEGPCHTPFRLRQIVAGRPGCCLQQACFVAGEAPASCAVEWPLTQSPGGRWHWPLPPQAAPDHQARDVELQEHPLFQPSPHPWGRGQGLLLELVAARPPELPGGAPQAASEQAPRSKWVHVCRGKAFHKVAVWDLCRELAGILPSLGLPSNMHLRPASFRQPGLVSEEVSLRCLLLRDLRWTQAERLYLYEASTNGEQPSPGCCGAAANSPLCLFFRTSARDLPPSPVAPDLLEGGFDRPSPSASSTAGRSRRGRPEVPLDGPVPHSQKLLHSSKGTRQFEFHPVRPNSMLVGRKDGTVLVLDQEADEQTHSLQVDVYPILGLSWLHTQPQWAVVGASRSGSISMVRYNENRPGIMEQIMLEPFSHLSSLSVNCTDDYFMTSGFCMDLGLYDVVTGRRLSTFSGMHNHFINILRFAHRSPHLFATASFDHTCKVWDLRERVTAEKPAQVFNTETLNVMCCFSPDDRHLLCSGVDRALQQFSLQAGSGASRFPLPSLGSETSYRRSLYLADGSLVGTAATNESLVRMYTAEAPHRHMGCISFRSMPPARQRPPRCRPEPESPQQAEEQVEQYVQSLRCHPKDPTKLAALLSTCDAHPESYISVVKLRDSDEDRLR